MKYCGYCGKTGVHLLPKILPRQQMIHLHRHCMKITEDAERHALMTKETKLEEMSKNITRHPSIYQRAI